MGLRSSKPYYLILNCIYFNCLFSYSCPFSPVCDTLLLLSFKIYITVIGYQNKIIFVFVCVLSHSVMSNSLHPKDCSLPRSSVHGIPQARKLEWVASPFSRGIPDPGIQPGSPALQADSLPLSHQGRRELSQSDSRSRNQTDSKHERHLI